MELDLVDKQLVKLLQEDCKKTTKYYADILQLSKTAVYERIRRLERTGVITQYVALVDKKKLQKDFTVLCHIRLVQHTKDNVLRFEREVLKLKEVSECFHVGGDYDYILKINVADMKSYREFMLTKLTTISNIGNTQSSFVISEVKNTPSVHIG
ncbi:Lrp/AsnC family transcriptional regulator, leucine-responsive regulatory protein [Flagellimonas taeanensis]|uniref:Lrp/AsnC family transcriptional regulator, leucine-responsive regulatory protein n=1 Tax=Flagellimonas taeanensis TaxID=1005926 RepID=A0A1M6ZIN4_9FLAO|nr:Lrp/AsnC family transcriptional regulator [Allomuricauda taeanensis]MEE1963867.1 Lrp/AsnC family transcriptional regulator [Allomuricauda taeanensis]SFC31132.1 Lrp/AsnC family transcriptional regulator, leucine-responsive regulatory protein [Allomuricauda taeanensis]SHL30368.1 transcriptional regulator, AsnC family [Allomuricauda taeanensis]